MQDLMSNDKFNFIEKTDLKGPANAVGRYRAYLNRGAQYLDRSSADSGDV